MAVSPSSFHGRFVVLTINIASFGLCFKGKHDIINKNYSGYHFESARLLTSIEYLQTGAAKAANKRR